jgi:hypothetical protein
MLDPFTMAMIGASVGALSNPKKPLKGALIGGTMGYAGGSALGGGGLLGGGAAGGSGLTSAATGLKAGTSYAPGTIESVMGSANAAGTYTNPDYFANILGNQVYTGNDGLLSQIGTGAGSIFDSAKTSVNENLTPQNLLGLSSILNNMESLPRPVASGANTITGTPPKFAQFGTGQVFERKRRGNA